MPKKIIIIGGVAGGMTAATRLRRLDETAQIIVFEKGEHVSYANCGLPYYVGDVIKSEEAILLQTPESLKERYELDVRIKSEVVNIFKERKRVFVKNLDTGNVYEESYDQLIIATGAEPIKPPIPGLAEAANIFTLRNVNDSQKLKTFITTQKPKNAVIIGAGFIGLEVCENLSRYGIHITIAEMLDQVLGPLDFEMASVIHKHLANNGVEVILKDGVKEFSDNGKIVTLQSGKQLPADLIILGIGVKPESKLAKEAGLELNERGAIKVNAELQTSDSNIYAIGDVIEVQDFINKQPVSIPLAWPANRQGRIVADNLMGKHTQYKGTVGAAITELYGVTIAVTGANEKTLKKLGIDYRVIHIHPGSHAGYYPGAEQMTLKLIFSPDGKKIYGAQGIGKAGIDKRLDVINTAIQAGMSVYDLQDLELCYSPQFASAKDAVNMLGYLASAIADKFIEAIQWSEVEQASQTGIILDIREEGELILGQIPGAMNIPLGQLRSRIHELPSDKTIYVYCQVGLRGYIATRILLQHQLQAKNIDGGYKTYSAVYSDEEAAFQSPTEDSGISQVVTLQEMSEKPQISMQIDACGLQCPGPLLKVYEAIKALQPGQAIEIAATDAGFFPDIEMWCLRTNNILVNRENRNGIYVAVIQKGQNSTIGQSADKMPVVKANSENGMTLIVFDGDLDKAIAAFILANGGAAYGKKVTMFFTFWGLNILRKPFNVKVKKTFLESMFGTMMPRGINKLGISKMNMLGMGTLMIKYIMNKKKVDSLEELMLKAIKNDVKLVACTMSMDIMGIKKEELIEGIELGGVGAYLGKADGSNINLFV